jgi:hypothetical protein
MIQTLLPGWQGSRWQAFLRTAPLSVMVGVRVGAGSLTRFLWCPARPPGSVEMLGGRWVAAARLGGRWVAAAG